MADAISNVYSSGVNSPGYANRVPVQKLEQDDFIKLLVTQLTTQDPLNPQKDTEFIGQMAQFSALESSKSMQAELQTIRASQLLGQTVEVRAGDDETVVGAVTGVESSHGKPKIIVADQAFSLSDVLRVQHPITLNQTA